MNVQQVAKYLDHIFHYILLGIFLLSSLMYLFIFALNWETWFFGMKIDGLYAGIILFIYFLGSASLAYLLVKYPKKIVFIALVSTFFFSFIFMDSTVTIRELSGGLRSYSEAVALRVILPVIVLIGHLIATRFYERGKESEECGQDISPALNIAETENPRDFIIKNILTLTVAAVVLFIIFGTLVIPVLILMYLPLAIRIFKTDDDPAKSDYENELNVTGTQLLLVMAILIALFLLMSLVIPVLIMLITK